MPIFKAPNNDTFRRNRADQTEGLPEGCVLITEDEYLSLVSSRAVAVDPYELMWNRIKAERDRRVQNGGYLASGHWFHSDTFSRTQQIGLVLLGSNIPPGLQWKTMDNGFVTMTQTLAGQIFAAAAASDVAHFSAAEMHHATMLASQSPQTYDFSNGWPEIYQ